MALRRIAADPRPIELPPPIAGLTIAHVSPRKAVIKFHQPSRDALIDLLAWLPPERSLFFWDRFYPQLTDPGAGVTIQSDGYRLYHQLGNHGWSSGWSIQSPELLAAWIMLNVEAPPPHEPITEMTLCRSPPLRIS